MVQRRDSPSQRYPSSVETSFTKSLPSMDGASLAALMASSSDSSVERTARIAPLSRRCFVSARVSMSSIPMI